MTFIILGALTIGLTLGMLGSGGSAITVPILVYLVGHEAKESIAEAMAIVGAISIAAAVPYARANQIDWRNVLCFGLPGMFGTFVGAWFGGIVADAVQLAVFGVVLVMTAGAMFWPIARKKTQASSIISPARWLIVLEGAVVGVLTGFVGVGGGFLIVPALVLLGGLPMRLAVGTSLVIIAINASVGFVQYEQYLISHSSTVDVRTISLFVTIGIMGTVFGKRLNTMFEPRVLKRIFAGFLLVLGSFVMLNEGAKLFEARKDRAVTLQCQSQHQPPESQIGGRESQIKHDTN